MGVITERERQKYFAYLDGVADGLNESSNDVNLILDKLRTEIEQRPYGIANDSVIQGMKYERAAILEILNKYSQKVMNK